MSEYPSTAPGLFLTANTFHLPSPNPNLNPTPIATLLPKELYNVFIPPQHATPYPNDPSYIIQNTPSKGFGMFASRLIQPGELILNEHPVLIVPERPLPYDSSAWDELGRSLPEEQRLEMLTLANCRPLEECPSPIEGIVRTNALVLDIPEHIIKEKKKTEVIKERFGGVFLKINRCNHSCSPNASHKWQHTNLSYKLYALRIIQPGEEISIFYTDLTQPRDIRRAELLKNHRFLCKCSRCDLKSEEEVVNSDNIRKELGQWLSTKPSYIKWSTDMCREDDIVITSHLLALSLIEKEEMHFMQTIFIEELVLSYAILGEETEFRKRANEFIQKCSIEDPERAAEFMTWLHSKKPKKWGWRKKQRMLMTRTRRRDPSPDYYASLLF